VVVGRDCVIYASAVVREGSRLGDRVILHPGSVIGADGFGFEADEQGIYAKVPQVGRVVIGDGADIGAGTCVDRAAFGETRIGAGTKIDNLCQIGHGTKIGDHTAISGMTGISGSVKIGNRCVLGGGVGIADHVTIGDRVMIAAGSGVANDIPPGSIVGGAPAVDIRTWKRSVAAFNLLGKRKSGTTGGTDSNQSQSSPDAGGKAE
jgi:UDP-3-O-[3-hydroxymyristoyl] glucosamine N-acyltransferase